MRHLVIALLLGSGLLMAGETAQQEAQQVPPARPVNVSRLSWTQRLALRSQAPAIKLGRKHRNNYQLTQTKGAIIATIPYGK